MSIECLDFRSHKSGALMGFANFRVPKMGIEIFGCGVFSKDGRRWLSLPSREFEDRESGEKKYIGIMKFIDKEHDKNFCSAALKVLDKWCEDNDSEKTEPQNEEIHHSDTEQDLPF